MEPPWLRTGIPFGSGLRLDAPPGPSRTAGRPTTLTSGIPERPAPRVACRLCVLASLVSKTCVDDPADRRSPSTPTGLAAT